MSNRKGGILLHITSLPGDDGTGTLGKNAYKFVDFLAKSKQKLWQILPLGQVGYGDSPYQCYSAFAGNVSSLSTLKCFQKMAG
jgi:4-alpha-glucanotransferase